MLGALQDLEKDHEIVQPLMESEDKILEGFLEV